MRWETRATWLRVGIVELLGGVEGHARIVVGEYVEQAPGDGGGADAVGVGGVVELHRNISRCSGA